MDMGMGQLGMAPMPMMGVQAGLQPGVPQMGMMGVNFPVSQGMGVGAMQQGGLVQPQMQDPMGMNFAAPMGTPAPITTLQPTKPVPPPQADDPFKDLLG